MPATELPDRRGNGSGTAPRSVRNLSRRRILTGVLLAVAAVISVVTMTALHVDGSPIESQARELGAGEQSRGITRSGTLSVNESGYVLDGQSEGTISVRLSLPRAEGERVVLRLWLYGGPEVHARATLVAADGDRLPLGETSGRWEGKAFDVTDAAVGRRTVLEIVGRNESPNHALLLDRVAEVRAPSEARIDVSPWLVGLWSALVFAALLQLFGRLGRHWILVPAAAVAAYVFVQDLGDQSLVPLSSDAAPLWTAATNADWIDLDTGLLSGSFVGVSDLSVQVFHALTPLVGEGGAGAYVASALIGLGTIAAIYAFGNRVAGRWGAIAGVIVALLTSPLRDAAVAGTEVTTLMLVAAILLYAVHASLADTSRDAAVLLGAAGALAVLANPLWLIGVVAAIGVLALRYGTVNARMRVFGIGLLVLAVLVLPNRISVAEHHEGDFLADVAQATTAARLAERSDTPPPRRATESSIPLPEGTRTVGLVEYVFSDHSASVVVGSTLTGAYDALGSYTERDEPRLAGLLAVVLALLGLVYLLLVPRLRMLVLIPALIALPELFFAGQDGTDPFVAGIPAWPAFLVSAGVLAYALNRLSGDPTARTVERLRSCWPHNIGAAAPGSAGAAGHGRLRISTAVKRSRRKTRS